MQTMYRIVRTCKLQHRLYILSQSETYRQLTGGWPCYALEQSFKADIRLHDNSRVVGEQKESHAK
jgi:hypothetical protein